MLKEATSTFTKQFQKQQILGVITKKYMEMLYLLDKVLVNNIDIKTIINMTEIIKKTNPVIIPKLWHKSVSVNFVKQISQIEKGDFTFWLNEDFTGLIDITAKDKKWNVLSKQIVNELQLKIKNGYDNNTDLKNLTNNLFKSGYEINKLVEMYSSL